MKQESHIFLMIHQHWFQRIFLKKFNFLSRISNNIHNILLNYGTIEPLYQFLLVNQTMENYFCKYWKPILYEKEETSAMVHVKVLVMSQQLYLMSK